MNPNPSTPDTGKPPEALAALLSDPEAIRRMSSILGAVLSAPRETDSTPPSTEQAVFASADREPDQANAPISTPRAASGAAEGLQAILSNPAMLEQLPKILAVMKPMLADIPSKPSSSAPPRPEDCRNRLLEALKPFLSPARCDAIDMIVRISHLGNVFSQLK